MRNKEKKWAKRKINKVKLMGNRLHVLKLMLQKAGSQQLGEYGLGFVVNNSMCNKVD